MLIVDNRYILFFITIICYIISKHVITAMVVHVKCSYKTNPTILSGLYSLAAPDNYIPLDMGACFCSIPVTYSHFFHDVITVKHNS